MARLSTASLLLALTLAGCPSDPAPVDAGTDAPIAPVDSPSVLDDAPIAVVDAPVGTTDVPVAADAPTGPAACTTGWAGCTTFTDLTGMSSTAVAVGTGFNYAPNCIRVDVGTIVTLPGLSAHPLMQGCGVESVGLGASGATTNQVIPFDVPGMYGFHCMFHGTPAGAGMAMAIQVVGP